MRLNIPQNILREKTHEGAPAKRISPIQDLRRSLMSCMLWEREFYEDGVDIATRIMETASDQSISDAELKSLAIEARGDMKLRHAPMLIALELVRRRSSLAAECVCHIVQRADELAEILNMYWTVNGSGAPMSKQLKRGLAMAFDKFDEYQLAKYDRAGPVRLRDVMFLAHPKPKTAQREDLYRRIADQTLAAPDTWEVGLSGGADKRETFERLLREGKLGYMALLRNLRNMAQSGVDVDLVNEAIRARRGAHRVLPFRYVAAASAAPQFVEALDDAMRAATLVDSQKLAGTTLVLVDVSGSMTSRLSARSDMTRMHAAAALGAIVQSNAKRVFSFSSNLVECKPYPGLAGVDAIIGSQNHMMTELGGAVNAMNRLPHDRLIVVTDEQSHTRVPDPVVRDAYMINVASAKNGVGYGKWRHIDGFSENVLNWIHELEA